MEDKLYDYINFTAYKNPYFPASMEKESWMAESWLKYTEMDIPIGKSRYGGCVIDLPKGIEYPKNLKFAGQLDLNEISPFDKTERLPKTGQLLFFADIMTDSGKVIFADVKNEDLTRVINEHEDNFFLGVLIDEITAKKESMEERYFNENDEEFDYDLVNEKGKMWNYFSGSEKSKIFGIYTHCQLQENEILEVVNSNEIVLFQIGENGFNDDGLFNVLIDQDDLKQRNFDNCRFEWVQS